MSRRTFLGRTAAVIGAVGAASVGGSSVLGATLAPPSALAGLDEVDALAHPVMLAVTDARRGEFEILIGESSVVFTDRELAGRLAHAAKATNHVVAS